MVGFVWKLHTVVSVYSCYFSSVADSIRSMGHFHIPAQTVQAEQLIKKSRFIAVIGQAADAQASHQFIASIRARYPDAGHVCWAFIAGEPGNTTAVSCSDDGEPAGTAGKPMLNVLRHSALGEVVAVVVRYFGGVKLGTGGLVRAYAGGVSELLKTLPTTLKVERTALTLRCPYPLEDVLRRTLERYDTEITALNYQQAIQLECLCPADQVHALLLQLNDAGRGQISFETVVDGA